MKNITAIIMILSAMATSVQTKNTSVAERVSQSATITLHGAVDIVFPLFGPIRERDWAEGWDPQVVFPPSAVAEEHMVFETKPTNALEDRFLWAITQYRPEIHFIEYTVSTENRIWFIAVACDPDGAKTRATITYTYTGRNQKGNALNREALEKMYADNLKDWEKAINDYLFSSAAPKQKD